MGRIGRVAGVVLTALVISLRVPADTAGGGSAFAPQRTRELFEKFKPALAVVNYSIEYYDPGRQQDVKHDLHCLGVVVDPSGLVMVRGHVSLANVKPFNVRVRLGSGARYDGTVLEKDKRINVAFVKLVPGADGGRQAELELPFVLFARNPSLNVGDEVMVLGILPEVLDFERTFQVRRVASVIETPRRVYVTDLPVPYGMTGGPVINAGGEAVGVIGYDLDPREGGEIYVRSGYPLIYTANLFQHLIDNPPTEQKESQEAWIGVFTQPLTDDFAEYWRLDKTGGVIISTVIQNSPAERAGMLRGDIIRMFDGEPVNAKERTDVRDFTRMVRESGAGRTVPVTVLRNGKPVELSVLLEEAPKTAAEAEKYEDENFGFTVREITADFIIVGDLDPGIKGLVVDRVEAAGWASLAGLLPGDILREFAGKQVTSIEELKPILDEVKAEKPKEVMIFIERRGRTGFLRIEPDWED